MPGQPGSFVLLGQRGGRRHVAGPLLAEGLHPSRMQGRCQLAGVVGAALLVAGAYAGVCWRGLSRWEVSCSAVWVRACSVGVAGAALVGGASADRACCWPLHQTLYGKVQQPLSVSDVLLTRGVPAVLWGGVGGAGCVVWCGRTSTSVLFFF